MMTILLHNVMVKERVANDEVEDASFYFSSDSNDENSEEMEPEDNGYNNSPSARHDKFKMAHKRWEELYSYEGSKELKDSMKRNLYSEKFGNDALSTAHLWM